MTWTTCLFALSTLALSTSATLYGQKGLRVAPAVRLTAKIDPSKRALLRGHVPAIIRSAPDMGRLNANTQLNHMIMVLSSSDEQEHVLRTLIDQQNDKSTENFHQWITPDAFQQSFGVAESDITTISTWLTQQGFSVEKVMKGGRVLQFNGTVGTFEKAFQTEFHKYQVGGVQHISVNSDISVPEALSSVVRAVPTVNDLFKHASITPKGTGKLIKTANGFAPDLTISSTVHYFGANDFATVYNTTPLLTAGNTGKGVTIGVVGRTDIGLNDVQIYRQIFNLPANDPVFTIAGEDPGVVPGDDGESYLDVEVSGGVATGATINFVTSKATLTVDGVDLSALYLVENNTADIISESYGQCENSIGSAGNAFENALWEQAAAQGISVFVSSGDNGPAACDSPSSYYYDQTGYSVSGLASTPYNVAVGGSQFSEGTGTYWSSSNPVGFGTALSYIPEIPWNEAATSSATSANGLYSGSGGISAYYVTPPWQRGYGVPTTDPAYPGTGATSTPSTPVVTGPHRYLPDVALNAAGGHDGTIYCAEGVCSIASNGSIGFGVVGGTSVAAPTMAGVQALVNQANGGRQGQPNYYYYALSQANYAAGLNCASSNPPAAGCAFHDVTSGNTLICGNAACTAARKIGWTAGPGFDLATGLGSPNVTQLSSQWKSVVFSSSTTSMSVSSVGSTHGTPTTLTVTVASGSGSGTPTGDVAIYTSSGAITNPIDENTGLISGQTPLCTLSGGTCTISLSSLPAGSYNLIARYAGDVTFGSSTSAPIAVTISPEAGSLSLVTNSLNCTTGTINQSSTFVYGASLYLDAKVAGSSAQGVPTGTITITDNGVVLTTQALNATGDAEIVAGVTGSCVAGYSFSNIPPLPVGSHTLSASYSGDKSFNATTLGTPVTITVTKASLAPALRTTSTEISAGAPVNLILTLTPLVATPATATPTGSVTFTDTTSGTNLGTVSVATGFYNNVVYGLASLNTNAVTTSGAHSIQAAYSGDANYASSSSTVTVTVGGAAVTSFTVSSTTLNPVLAASNMLTATIAPTTATGTVYFYDGTTVLGSATLSSGSAVLQTQARLRAGVHSITAVYAGKTTVTAYSSTTSTAISVNVSKATPTVNLTPGKASFYLGQVETLTSVVGVPQTAAYVAYIAPTGTVQFFDGSTPLGSPTPLTVVPYASGGYGIYEAVFTTSSLSVGTHTITSVFTDPNYVTTTSNTQTVTILANTATTLTLNPSSPVVSGTVVTAMASVTASATATPVVSGVVNFYDTSATPTLVGTAELTAAGTATAKLVPGVGSHTIIAQFQGTPAYPGPTSAQRALVVTAAGTYKTTNLLVNIQGNIVDFATFYGQVVPGGSVQFTDVTTNTVLGTVSPTPLTQTFAAPLSYTTGAASTGSLISATGDFNKDGYPDVAVTNLADKSVSVLLGTGTGTFQPQTSYTVGTAPYGVAVGDFNGDGNLDLAVTNLVDGTVSVLLGTGTGSFGSQVAYPTGSTGTSGATTFPEPYGITVADMNKDGILDLVTTNTTENSVSVLLGSGTGAFAAPVTTPAGAEPFTTAAADFSGDGIADLMVINARDSTASYLVGKGDGTFTVPSVATYATGLTPYAVAVGDYNGDGRPDLAVANLGDPNAAPTTGSVTILLSSAGGGFTSAAYPTGVEPTGIVALDYDGDGKLDLAVANLADNTVGILKGDGTGGFAAQVAFPSVASPYALSVADFNGDGKQDLAVTTFGGNAFALQLGAQTATVTLSSTPAAGDSITASYVPAAGDAYATSTSNTVQTLGNSPAVKRLSTKRAQ